MPPRYSRTTPVFGFVLTRGPPGAELATGLDWSRTYRSLVR
jgi:hypothetical protein